MTNGFVLNRDRNLQIYFFRVKCQAKKKKKKKKKNLKEVESTVGSIILCLRKYS